MVGRLPDGDERSGAATVFGGVLHPLVIIIVSRAKQTAPMVTKKGRPADRFFMWRLR